jgi:hypothetical protein
MNRIVILAALVKQTPKYRQKTSNLSAKLAKQRFMHLTEAKTESQRTITIPTQDFLPCFKPK